MFGSLFRWLIFKLSDFDFFALAGSEMIVDFGQQFVFVQDVFDPDLRNRVMSKDSLGNIDTFLNIAQ